MSKQPKLELIYFNLRALAEPPQMMMHYAGVKYRYEMAWDYYGKPWSKAKLEVPFGQLPVLVVNDTVHIWQSGAIVRYLAKLAGFMPEDPVLAAQVDAVFEQTQELFAPLNLGNWNSVKRDPTFLGHNLTTVISQSIITFH